MPRPLGRVLKPRADNYPVRTFWPVPKLAMEQAYKANLFGTKLDLWYTNVQGSSQILQDSEKRGGWVSQSKGNVFFVDSSRLPAHAGVLFVYPQKPIPALATYSERQTIGHIQKAQKDYYKREVCVLLQKILYSRGM